MMNASNASNAIAEVRCDASIGVIFDSIESGFLIVMTGTLLNGFNCISDTFRHMGISESSHSTSINWCYR
jgi:hypothetical protein